ncbi:unnamed protein product, partial [marine sediment metagenome]
ELFKENDNIVADGLFDKIRKQTELIWKKNQSIFYKWKDEYYANKYNID